jgi:hypothetical protein
MTKEYIIMGFFILLFLFYLINLLNSPKKIKEFLLFAVSKAERELGGGTGKLKLRYVYSLFIEKFPIINLVISFDFFSKMVDKSLIEMRELIEQNNKIKKYIEGDE